MEMSFPKSNILIPPTQKDDLFPERFGSGLDHLVELISNRDHERLGACHFYKNIPLFKMFENRTAQAIIGFRGQCPTRHATKKRPLGSHKNNTVSTKGFFEIRVLPILKLSDPSIDICLNSSALTRSEMEKCDLRRVIPFSTDLQLSLSHRTRWNNPFPTRWPLKLKRANCKLEGFGRIKQPKAADKYADD